MSSDPAVVTVCRAGESDLLPPRHLVCRSAVQGWGEGLGEADRAEQEHLVAAAACPPCNKQVPMIHAAAVTTLQPFPAAAVWRHSEGTQQ